MPNKHPSPSPSHLHTRTSKDPQHHEVIILGAGAAGLFCALSAGHLGRQVTVIDHANKAGKKILMSGGGRCNFTNLEVTPAHFVSDNCHFVRSALAGFRPEHFLQYVHRHGIAYYEKSHGQLFCEHSSKDILQMLLDECAQAKVNILLNQRIIKVSTKPQQDLQAVDAPGSRFMLEICHSKTGITQRLHTDHLVVATGGLSIPTLGATGLGYELARQFGHQIIPTEAALVPFIFSDDMGKITHELSGTSLEVSASTQSAKYGKARFDLPMLFTHRGLSGPAILQLSNYWHVSTPITIDLAPDSDLGKRLITHKQSHPKQLIKSCLAEVLGKKLTATLEPYHWQALAHTELGNIKDAALIKLGATLNQLTLKPSSTEGYRTAEVTRGGVATDEISSKTMQSARQAGLYFIGEVLDVTGWLGGYNFQWAWASAHACANAIATQTHTQAST